MSRVVLCVLVLIAGAFVSRATIAAQDTGLEQALKAYEAGRAAIQRQEWSAAISHFARAESHAEIAPAARLHRGLVHEHMGQADQAAADYLAVRDMQHVTGPVMATVHGRLLNLGSERARKGDLVGAEALLKIASGSARIDALTLYTHVLIAQKKWAEAEKVATRLLDHDPAGLAAWSLLVQAHKGRADTALADPAKAEEGAKLMKTARTIAEKGEALPFFLEEVALDQENDTHVVRATMLGNAAPAGSWCIIDFKLNMGNKTWRASSFVTAPPGGEKVKIKALPATSGGSPNPPHSSELVYSVSYSLPYCEVSGAAAQAPPDASKARLKGCPETSYEANELVEGRDALGSLPGEYNSWEKELSFPAGGIELFGEPITRLVGKETTRGLNIFHFGLPGEHADYVDRFNRAYKRKNPSCRASGHCETELDETKERGVLFSASLERLGPTRLLPEGTYLRCQYR